MLQSIHVVFDEANIRLVWVSDKADDAVWETSLDAENRTLGNVRDASKIPATLSPMILSSSRAWAFKVSLFISFLPFSSIWTAAIV